jgi:hypothetical protein
MKSVILKNLSNSWAQLQTRSTVVLQSEHLSFYEQNFDNKETDLFSSVNFRCCIFQIKMLYIYIYMYMLIPHLKFESFSPNCLY